MDSLVLREERRHVLVVCRKRRPILVVYGELRLWYVGMEAQISGMWRKAAQVYDMWGMETHISGIWRQEA